MVEIKEIIQKILESIIIAFVSFGLISNLESIINIRKKYSYDFDKSVEINSIRNTIETLKINLEQIKTNPNNKLSEEQLNEFETYLTNIISDVEEFDFINETGIRKYTEKEWMNILLKCNSLEYTGLINIYDKLSEYDDQLQIGQENFIENIYYLMISRNQIYQQLYNNYQYGRINNFTNKKEYLPNMVLGTFVQKLNIIEDVSNLIIENNKIFGGEENE